MQSYNSDNCRAEYAQVLEIFDVRGNLLSLNEEVPSHWRPSFMYQIGKTVHAVDYNADKTVEMVGGIHFVLENLLIKYVSFTQTAVLNRSFDY